jgi:hypothetical protein
MQYVPPLTQESPALTGRVARHLLHPSLVWVARKPGQADAATLQMNEEQDVVCTSPRQLKTSTVKKSIPANTAKMRLNELLPRRVLASFRRRCDAMPL